MTDDLITFLRARLDDDEWMAKRAGAHHPTWTYDRETFSVSSDGGSIAARKDDGSPINDVDGEHIARHDPARELREVTAKRRILDAYVDATRMHRLMEETDDDAKWDWLFRSEALEGVLRLMTLPYSDHPGYREDWIEATA